MSVLGPGWHDDPAGTPGTYRWWDGAAWTRWLSRDRGAPDPTSATAPAAPEQPAPEPAAGPAAPAGPVLPPDPLVRMPVAVAVVLAVLLVAVVALGVVVSASAQGLPSGPAVAPPARTVAPALDYDQGARTVAVGKLRLTLAGSPYVCADAAEPSPPTLELGVVCGAAVHRDYDGHGADWSATTVVGVLPPALAAGDDLAATARSVFTSLRGQYFPREKTTVTGYTAQPADLGSSARAVVAAGEVHYRVPGVASRYDRLLVVVTALPDGTHAVVASSRPDDSSGAVTKALQASLDSIRVG